MGRFNAASEGGMVAYLFMWGLFTFVMWIATLKHNKAFQVVFFTLFILFWLLALVRLPEVRPLKPLRVGKELFAAYLQFI